MIDHSESLLLRYVAVKHFHAIRDSVATLDKAAIEILHARTTVTSKNIISLRSHT